MDKIVELKKLYNQSSKHSNYQILSTRLSSLLKDNIVVKTRYEKERLDFILDNIDITNKRILDIGGNTGYFSFELIEHGAKHIHYYEGNSFHANFVKLAADMLDMSKKIEVNCNYYSFEQKKPEGKFDIILLLNVLHHIGDDYGSKGITIEDAKKNIILQLNSLADKTSFLIFQLGFNWKGNSNLGLFENGTKNEMISFVKNNTLENWKIHAIGVAEKEGDRIVYNTLNENNIVRNDSLGEFLNRPIFLLESLK